LLNWNGIGIKQHGSEVLSNQPGIFARLAHAQK